MILYYDEAIELPSVRVYHPSHASDISTRCANHESEVARYVSEYNTRGRNKRELFACALIEGQEIQLAFAELQEQFQLMLDLVRRYH